MTPSIKFILYSYFKISHFSLLKGNNDFSFILDNHFLTWLEYTIHNSHW